ncbi:MAG: reverse transcriptase-like protein [Ignavibacteriae bacterium]|nr:reverse transcriptase-like protein [Ignavibacteriota bacterium]
MHNKEYKYEYKLKEKSSEFISHLSGKNILADIISGSVREYSVKLKAIDIGVINLYYSPNQDAYKITLQEIPDEGDKLIIQNCWNELHGIKEEIIYKDKGIEIDVDGSYRKGVTSYGAVIRKNGKIISELSGIVEAPLVKGSHQIAGEIKAVTESINWCNENGVKEVTIYYDYKGLEKWASGKWKTKKAVSQEYYGFMKNNSLKIHWVKIESHTGKKWNEYADRLAAKAADGHKQN